ncbi:hypothetical protein ACFSTD_01375 [Novosphingobium colocasiae]
MWNESVANRRNFSHLLASRAAVVEDVGQLGGGLPFPIETDREYEMDVSFTAEEEAFRREIRAFIAAEYPQSLRDALANGAEPTRENYLTWMRILAKKKVGWQQVGPKNTVARAGASRSSKSSGTNWKMRTLSERHRWA